MPKTSNKIIEHGNVGQNDLRYCEVIHGVNLLTVPSMMLASYYSYARPAQPGPNRARLCGPCIAAIAGD